MFLLKQKLPYEIVNKLISNILILNNLYATDEYVN